MDNQTRLAKLRASLGGIYSGEIMSVAPVLCAPYDDDLSAFGFQRVTWAPYTWIGSQKLPKDHELLQQSRVFSIGLASVLACLQLELQPRDKVLDMCAAPGIKSLYLQLLHNKSLDLYVNDVSHDRLLRLRTLFERFNLPLPTFTNQPGQSLHHVYEEGYFDAVIIDAPCSGEGNVLAGDDAALATWSPAKVRRLADLQRKLIKTGMLVVSPKGQLIYATCTLNTTENEQALRRAKCDIESVNNQPIQQMKLEPKQAVRIVPSEQSIGFFVGKLQ